MSELLDSTTRVLKQDLDKHHLDNFIEHFGTDLTKPELATQKKDLLDQVHGLLVQAHLIPDVQVIDGVQNGAIQLHDASGKSFVLNAQGQESPTESAPPHGPAQHSSYREARQAAREVSEKDINEKDAHAIAFGDTLWDMARASFKKHNGHNPSDSDITKEVARIAKKNGVNPNSIPIGTVIYTDMAEGRPVVGESDVRTTAALDPTGVDRTVGPPIRQDRSAAAIRTEDARTNQGSRDQGTGEQSTIAQGTLDQSTGDQNASGDSRSNGAPIAPETGNVPETAVATSRGSAWLQSHLALVTKAETSDADVVFFGDSITHGMQLNNHFRNLFSERAQNFGIQDDRTANLLWRLENGEADFRTKAPHKAVLLIGANDIGKASTDDIVKGILANARVLQQKLPNTQILVLGVLPQGEDPNDPVRHTIREVNRKLGLALAGSNVVFRDVGSSMLDSNGRMLAGVWQADKKHPTYGPGYDALFGGLRTYV
jgi:beta-glucosidase